VFCSFSKRIIVTLVLALAPTTAVAGFCPDFPAGPQLDRLKAVCDILKDETPEWTTEDCCHFFMVAGARATYESLVMKLRSEQKRLGIRNDLFAFDVDLPGPAVIEAPATGIGE
jgi:hypothetical protein